MNCSIIAGIDCGKSSFALTLLDTKNSAILLSKCYGNSADGFSYMLSEVAGVYPDFIAVNFCIENVGVYAQKLCYFLHHKDLNVSIADPGQVHRSIADPGYKTDLVDSHRIAQYGQRYPDRLNPFVPKNPVIDGLGDLLNARETHMKHRTAYKNQLKQLKVKENLSAAAIENAHAIIALLTERIQWVEKQMNELIKEDATLSQNARLLKSIPGVGMIVTFAMLVYTEGGVNLPTPRQASSHLGTAPRVYRSGSSVHRKTRSRGYGPSVMRKLLYLSAMSAKRWSAPIEKYYEEKKAQGKHGSIILNNICNRQLKLMLTILRTQKPYVKNYKSVHPNSLTLS